MIFSRTKLIFLALLFFACEPGPEKQEIIEETAIHEDIPDSVGRQSLPIVTTDTISLGRKLNRMNFEDSVVSLYRALNLKDLGLEYKVFRYGLIGFLNLKEEKKVNNNNLFSIIDFSQSSCNKRFYTINLDDQEIVFNTYVSHGRNTGQDMAKLFSDDPGSNQSSIGFYTTAETYVGSKGYSLRLDGMEKGYNENLRRRAVVMHDADYVSEDWIKRYGRLGRSQGCPALPKNISKKVIDRIKDRTAIFAYYEDDQYIKASNYLNLERLLQKWEQNT